MTNACRNVLHTTARSGAARRIAGKSGRMAERCAWRRTTVLLFFAAALITSGYVVMSALRSWLAIDNCLDRGGRWSEATQSCHDGGLPREDEKDATLYIGAAANLAREFSRLSLLQQRPAMTSPRCRHRQQTQPLRSQPFAQTQWLNMKPTLVAGQCWRPAATDPLAAQSPAPAARA